MRRPFISGNWKMNLDRASIATLCEAIKQAAADISHTDVGVFPPYPYLPEVVRAFEGLEASGGAKVYVGGQDLHPAAKGAFTSQVSGPMLKDVGATHTLIGHSERRDLFGDTDMLCREKMVAALEYGIKPVLCVGEHLEDREAGRTAEVVLGQVEQGLQGFSEGDLADLIIAYEPVWAIGTGKTATPEQAGEAHKIIRDWMKDRFSPAFADALRILYGGSVSPDNVDTLMAVPDLDGTLVGGASLKAEKFTRIMRFQAS